MALTQIVNDGLGASLTATSEGGAVTTSVQQGLAKVWANLNGSTFGLRDNNGISSATDNGTGDYTFTFSSAMNNSDYGFTNGYRGTSDNNTDFSPTLHSGSSATTSSIRFNINDSSLGSASDIDYICVAIHGDLA